MAERPPETLWQLAKLVVRAGLKGVILRLLIALTLGFFAFLVHTYLLVVVNEGFNENGGWVSEILALRRWKMVTGTAIWGLAGFLLTSLFYRTLFRGPIRSLRDFFGTPTWVLDGFREGGLYGVPAVLIGMALGALLGTFLGNAIGVIEAAVVVAFSLTMQGSGLMLVAAMLAASDLRRATGLRAPFPVAWVVVVQAGMVMGLIRAAAMPFQPTGGYLLTLGLLGAALIFAGSAFVVKQSPASAALLVVVAGVGAARMALGDDGGWQEAGGTFGSWARSQGAAEAVVRGLGPGAATFVGVWLGAIFGGFPADQLPTFTMDDGKPTQIKDLPQDLKDLKDAITGFLGTERGAGFLNGLLEGLYGLDGTADEAIEAYADWLRNNTEILEGGMVRYTDDAARMAQLDEMLRATRAQDWARRIGDGATVVGVVFDAYENIRQGDAWYYGIGKASGAGALMARIGERVPALGLFEFGNFVFFGGSKAGDCISPTRNITGGFNVLVDTLVDHATGQDTVVERMERGDYGENVRNLAAASQIAGEYWENPEEVGEELADFVTDERTWDDMYDRSHEVWKPPPGAWLPRQVGSAVGELATDMVIAGGEATAGAAQAAGDVFQTAVNAVTSWFRG